MALNVQRSMHTRKSALKSGYTDNLIVERIGGTSANNVYEINNLCLRLKWRALPKPLRTFYF
eukprot:5113292-Pyramimonas_sp.AAC.1